MTDSEKELVKPCMTDDELQEWVSELDRRANIDCGGGGWIDPFPIENTVNWKSARAIEQLLRERDEANLHVAALLESNRILTRERDEARAELERVMRGLVTVPLLQRAEAAEAEVARLREALKKIVAAEFSGGAKTAIARAALEANHD